ncbi:MAG: glycosyltransferase family 39 protein [Acidimicrobiia bacterium]
MRAHSGGIETAVRRARPLLTALLLLGIISLALPLIVAHSYGALGIPRGDDWSYLQTLFRFARHGTLDGNSWVSMTLLGQLVVAVPVVRIFGDSITAVQITVAVAGFGGLLATVAIGGRIVGTARATVVALVLGSSPLWGPLTVSFMTDIPAFAATMAALAMAGRAFASKRISRPLLGASLACGVFAFSIRQYAIVAVVVIGMTAIWSSGDPSDRRSRASLTAMLGLALFACAAIYLGWSQIPHLKTYVPALPDGHSISVTVIKGGGFFRLVGLILAPIVVLADPVAIVRRAWHTSKVATLVLAPGFGVVLAALSVRVPGQQFVGNYVDANGTLSSDALLGHRPDLFPTGVYALLVLVATASALVIALRVIPPVAQLIERARRRDFAVNDRTITCLTLTVGGYFSAYVFAMLTGVSVYDRYALPLIPLIGILLLHRADGSGVPAIGGSVLRKGGVAVALVGVALVGLVFTIDSASFDGTRWKVAVAATHRGYARSQINGGFEWVNFYRGAHRPRIVVGAKAGPRSKPGGVAPVSGFCVSVVVDPKSDDDRPVILERAYESPVHAAARIVALKSRCRHPVTP